LQKCPGFHNKSNAWNKIDGQEAFETMKHARFFKIAPIFMENGI